MTQTKVALITGSAKRLGAHISKKLHQQGYNVVVHYHHSKESAQQLVDELNKQREQSAKLIQGDLCTEVDSIAEQAISAFGRMDVLINNASSFYPTPINNFKQDDWNSLIGSNMQAPLFLSQKLHKYLTQNQGVIINMVDIHAKTPLSNHTLYCMAKAGLAMMTQSLAKELAPEVRVNGVAPGAILWPESEVNEQQKANVIKQIPLGKMGSVDDIADTVLFLIKSSYITGQIIAVDGGKSLSGSEIL